MEHLKDILGEVFPQTLECKAEAKTEETDEIKQALKHANSAIGNLISFR